MNHPALALGNYLKTGTAHAKQEARMLMKEPAMPRPRLHLRDPKTLPTIWEVPDPLWKVYAALLEELNPLKACLIPQTIFADVLV